MQNTILAAALLGIGLVALAFIFVIKHSSTRRDDYELVVAHAYTLRRWFMIAVCVFGLVVSVASLTPFPLNAMGGEHSVVVNAVGGQWYWKLDANTVPAGEPVQFRVSSADVNHGFAIYDVNQRIVAQTQAMPGYINKLNVLFTEPGTYRVLCLEYCGLAHHGMVAEFTVVEAD